MADLTPTQQCILDLLAGWLPIDPRRIHGCLRDELGDLKNIKVHISVLRRLLRPYGVIILCVIHRRRMCYQLVPLPPAGAFLAAAEGRQEA